MSGTPQNKNIGTFLRGQKRGRSPKPRRCQEQNPVTAEDRPLADPVPPPPSTAPVEAEVEAEQEESADPIILPVDPLVVPPPREAMATGPQIKIQTFSGKPGENGVAWLERYSSQCQNLFRYNIEQVRATFPYYLTGQAEAWFNSLQADTRNDPEALERQFKERFDGKDSPFSYGSIRQRPSETVSDYTTRFLQGTNYRNLPVEWLLASYVDGLQRDIRLIVKPQELHTLDDARRAATRAEQSLGDYNEVSAINHGAAPPTNPQMAQLLDMMATLCHTLQSQKPLPHQHQSRPRQGRNVSSNSRESNHLCKVCSVVGHFEQNCPKVLEYKARHETEQAQSKHK